MVIKLSSDRLGIVLILVGMSLFSIQDVLIKLIILEASLIQILVCRAFLGSIVLICFLYFTKRPIKLGSAYPLIAITRGVLFFVGFTLFYVSLTKIPLAEANSLFFINPVFMTIFSVFILNTWLPTSGLLFANQAWPLLPGRTVNLLQEEQRIAGQNQSDHQQVRH